MSASKHGGHESGANLFDSESIQRQADLLRATEIAQIALAQYSVDEKKREDLQRAIDSVSELKRQNS